MRVLLGLSALAALVAPVAAQSICSNPSLLPCVSLNSGATGIYSQFPPLGQTALATISVYQQFQGGTLASVSPPIGGGFVNSGNFAITVQYTISTVVWQFGTNQYTAQVQYRWYPGYQSPASLYPTAGLQPTSYTCDPCAGGTAISCNTAVGPTNGTPGSQCSLLNRVYTMPNLVASTSTVTNTNSFSVQLLDRQTAPGPNTSSYSFTVTRLPSPIQGDPQIIGMQGQDFQVHGVPDEIFNMITYPNLQVNARFVYLSSATCIDNYTACFAHPGTYISEEGIRVGHDKIHVRAGSAKKGLTVSVNGKKLSKGSTQIKLGSVELINHRRVVVSTPVMTLTVTNSDKFLNQETSLLDRKLIALGADRRVLGDAEQFHPEVPLHGLQGQTWRNVEYPSGLEYEGSISDYQIADGNLWGTSFAFNKFQL